MHTALSRLNEEERKEYWAALALRYAKGLGARSIYKLLKHFGSAYEAVQNTGDWSKISLGARAKCIEDDAWRTMAAIEWENAKDLDAHILLWTSDLFPKELHAIDEAPPMLYAFGNLDLMKNPCIAVVGSRECSKTGAQIAEYFATALSLCGFTVISGMAKGVDRAAHIGSLKHISSSIGVLGCGIDIAYPNINSDIYYHMRKKGLLLSEFAPQTPPDPRLFPVRNRIISGMSKGVVVVEAGIQSGTTITAYKANDQGKNVYVVPGALGSAKSLGCQELIRKGAKAIFNAEDILEDIIHLLSLEPEEVDKLLKSHKLSSEILFKHESVLIKKSREKKRKEKEKKNKEIPLELDPEIAQTKKRILNTTIQDSSADNFTSLYQIAEEAKQEQEQEQDIQEAPLMHKECYAKDSLEYKILELIFTEKMHVDTLCQILSVSVKELTVCLINLEMQEHITRYEGSCYGYNTK